MTTTAPKARNRRPSDARPTRSWWQSPALWVGALIAVAAVVAFALAGEGDTPEGTAAAAEVAPVEVDGAPLPPLSDPDPGLGLPAPTLSGQSFDGSMLDLGPGEARLYGFFAHWCPHCQAELPTVTTWLETNTLPDGVELVAVSTAVEPTADNYPPSAWFDREGFPGSVLVDDADGTAASALGLTAFPFWVVTAADGTVLARTAGQLSEAQFGLLVELAAEGR